jgi:hypothetical protein
MLTANRFREQPMSRWTVVALFAMAMTGTAFGADNTVTPRARRQAVHQLPAGLPRPHYDYRTTVADQPRYVGGRLYVRPRPADEPDLLFTPTEDPYVRVPDVRPLISRPLLPGSSTLPGYYGSSHSYYVQWPYYGGLDTSFYWNRLPYACGVYGYC